MGGQQGGVERPHEADQGQSEGIFQEDPNGALSMKMPGEGHVVRPEGHISPKIAFNNTKWKLHRVTLQDDDPPEEAFGQEGQGQQWGSDSPEQGSLLSKAMKLASDTYKSVANLWSPGKIKPSGGPERIAVPKLNLDGTKASHNPRKRKAQDVLVLARQAAKSDAALRALEADFVSNSSRASKGALRLTISKIFKEAKAGSPSPPTVDKVKLLAGVLKQANYRAAPNYLGEYKLMCIEAGQAWSDRLERTLKLCKRSVLRALGPKKKAPEVPTSEVGKHFSLCSTSKKVTVVPAAKELFEFGVIWMLREIELSLIKLEHLKLDMENKRVTLTIPVSKTDQGGATVTRILQCMCDGNTCCTGCPMRISAKLVFKAEDAGHNFVAYTNKGKKATKSQVIREWQKLYGNSTTGHSARRTGALRYIKHGWAIAQVAYLGKWKSSVIYEYAAEALESLPVNTNRAFIEELYGTKEQSSEAKEGPKPSGSSIEDVKNYLMAEICSFREGSEKSIKALDFEVESLKKKAERHDGNLPPYVQALNSKIIHHNWRTATCSPPLAWRTLCGWQFHKSDFVFSTKGTEGE